MPETSSISENPWRSFRAAAWLGWQIESNWTRPAFFLLYSMIQPFALVAILVVLYGAATHGNFSSPVFAAMYLGNAFYLYVGAVMGGMAYAVVDDRERYQTLRTIYVAPVDIRWYLIGRGVARFVIASASVAVILVIGIFVLHLPIHAASVQWPLLVAALLLGAILLAILGLLLTGFTLIMAHQSWRLGDATAGALYIFTGAIFPIEVLPRFLRPIGYALPITYWLELLRRALLGSAAAADAAFPTFAAWSSGWLLAVFAATTFIFGAIALLSFRWCDAQARDRGLLDRTTAY